MNMIVPLIITLLFSFSAARSETITPQKVIDQILSSSDEIKEIELTEKSTSTAYEKSLSPLQWNLSSDLNYEDSERETLQAFSNNRDKTLSFGLDVSKKIKSGTTFTLGYSRQSRDSDLNSIITGSNPNFTSIRNLDSLYFQIEQEMWRNSLGHSDRMAIETGRLTSEKSVLDKLESIEELVLNSLQAFWDTYVAKENLQSSLDLRKRYEELVKTVKSKKRLGYSNPGELAQALAEYEDNEQKVKQYSANYLTQVKELYRLIKQPEPVDIQFQIAEEIPALPAKPISDTTQLRTNRSLEIDVKVSENTWKQSLSNTDPKLNLVAKSTYTGADEEASEAFSEMTGGNHPVQYIGLVFEQDIFSRSNVAANKEAHYNYERSKISSQIALTKLKNQIDSQYKDVVAKQMVAESSIRSLKHREQAAKEVQKAFKQGRSDINNLIQVYNALSQTQAQKIKAVGEYHMALNTLAALTDQLIKDKK